MWHCVVWQFLTTQHWTDNINNMLHRHVKTLQNCVHGGKNRHRTAHVKIRTQRYVWEIAILTVPPSMGSYL